MLKGKSCYERLVEKALQPSHPSQQGYLPVIMLAPQPHSSSLHLGYFKGWAKPDGSEWLMPEHDLRVNNSSLRFGGYNLHQPNAGAVTIDPDQAKHLEGSWHCDFPLPAPIIVTKEGEPDLAPLLASHLGQTMWSEAAFEEPFFTTSNGNVLDHHFWVVRHSVYHGVEPAPRITVIAGMTSDNCTSERKKLFHAEFHRLSMQAAADRLKALHGRVASSLGREVYFQS